MDTITPILLPDGRRRLLTDIGATRVSTVELPNGYVAAGLGYAETLIKSDNPLLNELEARYQTWDEAVASHHRIVRILRLQLPWSDDPWKDLFESEGPVLTTRRALHLD